MSSLSDAPHTEEDNEPKWGRGERNVPFCKQSSIPLNTLPNFFSISPNSRWKRLTPPEYAHKVLTKSLPGASPTTKIVQAACARHHTVLVGSEGQVWVAGKNDAGQCGVARESNQGNELKAWTLVKGNWAQDKAKIVQVSCGLTFTLFLADNGWVYASGSSEKGQLGNGKTGERIVSAGKTSFDFEDRPKLIKPFTEKKIMMIASGSQHSLALSDDGYVWAWGFAGYARLGLGDQKDRLTPTLVPAFTGSNIMTRASYITCGPACSIVVNRQKVLQIAGKFKMTGDGSGGSPFMSCKVKSVACGGNGLFMITPSDANEVMCVAWGQGCQNGELGLGEDQPKNATKPVRIIPMNGLDTLDIAASSYTTYWLIHPNQNSSELDRWPADVDSSHYCVACSKELKDNLPLECEKCDQPYHLGCLDPPLSEVPDGEWFCPKCSSEAEDPNFMPAFPAITQIDGATETQQNGKQSAKSVKESTPASEKAATGSKRKGASADGPSKRKK
ncbi:hypothetical protein QFC24_000444 [Naganishia onofrii]|uniref:Uncharacterized protein n=1 Tax=Naganishia onofrii TaxID=1851511 RepID=A0ACC2XW03_9TREE|nr:hypothetical protein QFC24_000444 [Naganishia onofrii]